MSALTPEQTLLVEAVAAQLYERDETTIKMPIFWPMVTEDVKKRYRERARRKLKTGEIEGWFKTQALAIRPGDGRPSKDVYKRAIVLAAE